METRLAQEKSDGDIEHGAASTSDVNIVFRDLQHSDLPAVKALHRDLFPVQYSDSFFNQLFNAGYYCLVGTVDDEVVTVASARALEMNGQPSREAYIMTLGVRARWPPRPHFQ